MSAHSTFQPLAIIHSSPTHTHTVTPTAVVEALPFQVLKKIAHMEIDTPGKHTLITMRSRRWRASH